MEIEQVGRRFYAKNAPFSFKDQLKRLGFTWDGERKQWWTGKQDSAEKAMSYLAAAPAATPERETVSTSARVITGRAIYKGKSYYVLFRGVSKKTGQMVTKLTNRDGAFVFWAKQGEPLEIVAQYRESKSIEELKAYAQKKAREAKLDSAVSGFQSAVARRERNFVPCGYPGCNPYHCDECDGEGRYGN